MIFSQSQIVSRQYLRQHWRRGAYASLLLASCATISLLANTQAFADPIITYTGAVTPVPPQGVTDWDLSEQYLTVGDSAAGTLNLSAGATTITQGLLIGYRNSSDPASVTVDGNGSILTVIGTGITIGDESSVAATLTVSNGGRVDSPTAGGNNIIVGSASVNAAQLIVTGQGSTFNAHDNDISVGFGSDGNLIIADGGQVTGSQLGLGAWQGTGTATISGDGSAWNGHDGIIVGQQSNGKLNIYDGGSINDSSLQIAYSAGTTGIVNIGGEAGQVAKATGNLNVNAIKFNRGGGGSNGTLNFNTTDGTTVRAAISGEGTINQIAGTTVFTGENSAFVGPVNITGGTLQLGDGGNTGNLTVDVDTGSDATHKGTLAFNRSDDVSFDHVITGVGSVKQMGNGTTTLTRDNAYTGGTLITAGTLSVSSDANLGDVAGGLTLDGGTLQITGTDFNSTDRQLRLGVMVVFLISLNLMGLSPFGRN